jgi:hypothetical protein
MFKDINNLNTDTVRNLAMSMLELLTKCDDETIKKVCHTKIEINAIKLIEIEKKKDNEDSDFEWEEDVPSPTIQDTIKVDMASLGTKSAHRYMRQNLIATTNPLDFVKNNFSNLLTDIKNDISSLKKLITQHYQELNLWEKEFSKLQQREEAKLNRKETNRKDVGKLQRAKQVDELENAKPQLKFPYKYQINTQEHIKEYAKKTNIAIDKNAIRNSLNLDEVPYNELNVSDDLILLLLAGVGVYTANLDSNYISTVMRLAEEGKLAYLVADSSISYGTNYPINRVFITKDLSDAHSTNTIFQLMSRAGRVGKSWIAEAFIDDTCAERIINSSMNNNDTIETDNINKCYDIILEENTTRDNKIIEEIKQKIAEEDRLKLLEEDRLKRLEEDRLKRLEEDRLKRLEEDRLKRLEEDRLKRLEEDRLKRPTITIKEKPKENYSNSFARKHNRQNIQVNQTTNKPIENPIEKPIDKSKVFGFERKSTRNKSS